MPPMIPSPLSTLKSRLKEAGNVLFMILIAVALFAALAYGVTNSTRSTGGDASKETNILLASQITQYGTELQTAIMRMKVSNGCTDEQISFENSIVSGYTNANAPANYTCHVFRPEGGNVVYQDMKKMSVDNSDFMVWTSACIGDIGTGGSGCGTVSSELDLIWSINVKPDVARAINAKLGYSNIPVDCCGGDWSLGAYSKFTGTFASLQMRPDGSEGRPSGAVEGMAGTAGKFWYYHVLVPR